MDRTLVKRVLGSIFFVLILTLLIAALQFYGVIGLALGRVCLSLAWIIGVAGIISSEWLWRKGAATKVAVGVICSITWAFVLFQLDAWAKHRGTLNSTASSGKATLPVAANSSYTANHVFAPKLPRVPMSQSRTVSGITLAVAIIDPTKPSIIVQNLSDTVAEGITWELVMCRKSDSAIFSFATQNIGYVKPSGKSAPYSLDLAQVPQAPGFEHQLNDGDELIGSLIVDCPLCKGNTTEVSFVWRQSGWFSELKNFKGKLLVPRGSTPEHNAEYIKDLESLVKATDRIAISEKPKA